jgi:hypothetical protein
MQTYEERMQAALASPEVLQQYDALKQIRLVDDNERRKEYAESREWHEKRSRESSR